MSQAPTPRGPLGQLLDDAKEASEKEWREIEADSGIPLATIQSWTSGRVSEPPLRGVMQLAKCLEIPPQAIMDRALDGYVPPLEQRVSDAQVAAPGDAGIADSGEAIGARADGKAKRGQQKRRR